MLMVKGQSNRVSNMVDMVLMNAAKQGDGLCQMLNQRLGIKSYCSSLNIVISERDAAKGFSPRKFLTLEPQMPLVIGKEKEIAQALYKQVSDEMKEYQPAPPTTLDVIAGFEVLSEVAATSALLAVEPNNNVVKVLSEKVMPLMREKLKAEFVTGVTIDANLLQTFLSFEKVALIAGLYDVDKSKSLILDKGILREVLPDALCGLAYFDALTRLSPVSFSLPFCRANCSWHFQGKGMWGFPYPLTNAFSAKFMRTLNPLSESGGVLGLYGLKNMSEPNIWRFMRTAIDGINRLLSYLVDIRNFADGVGKVDFLRQIQAHCAIHVLFADILAMNFSTEAHHRINFAFAALDKYANLRVKLGNQDISEPSAVKALCSISQRDELLRLYSTHLMGTGGDELVNSLSEIVTRCYGDLHEHLGKQGSTEEKSRLERLWSQRNIRHGTFLERQQFERLFLESGGTVPNTIAALPFLLMLGFISNPKEFLQFQPTIQLN